MGSVCIVPSVPGVTALVKIPQSSVTARVWILDVWLLPLASCHSIAGLRIAAQHCLGYWGLGFRVGMLRDVAGNSLFNYYDQNPDIKPYEWFFRALDYIPTESHHEEHSESSPGNSPPLYYQFIFPPKFNIP